ncbi:LacI family DNA-binding transcriptional regulator [Cobetia sp. L2A1]|uniref:LacI family DNA-binding transcriptional regulator n=1 Tax=Cobetia sp. L2A1 TaxID=2686360 RepID=UPI00131D919E|nr:LacI family DNA-binding transcriptional regulator [Cobetia sp. L2A1]
MIRLKEVAAQAGVSVTTVSHVVNATRPVAKATEARVREAIKALGYRPDSVARALKSNRSRTLGMIVTSAHNPFFAEVIRGVEDRCYQAGYSLILCNSDDIDDKQLNYLETLRDRRIDGLVVMTAKNGAGFLEALSALPLPTVMMDAHPQPGWDMTVINDDSRLGGRLAIEHLLAQGIERIALLTGPKDHARSRERLAGAMAALRDNGLGLPEDWQLNTELMLADGHCAAHLLLANPDDRPEAIFAFNDLLALGCLRAAQDLGIRVPQQLSVIGYDDIEISAYLSPALTTIRQPIYALGTTAVDQLIARLEGTPFPGQTQLAPTLVVRESVKLKAQP